MKRRFKITINVSAADQVQEIIRRKKASGALKTCANGHLVDEWGYCLQKGCKYGRAAKGKRGR